MEGSSFLRNVLYALFVVVILFLMWLLIPHFRETDNFFIDLRRTLGRGLNPLLIIVIVVSVVLSWKKRG